MQMLSRKILLGLFVITSFTGFSQKETLPTYRATYYNRGLRPQTLSLIRWIDGTQNFIYNDNWTKYIIKDKNNRTVKELSMSDFYQAVPSLEYIPYIEHINKDVLVFSEDGNKYVFNYNNNTLQHTLSMDKDAENDDYSFDAQSVAYTKGNNLFVSTPSFSKYAVTNITDPNIVSGKSIHRNEFGIEKGTFWSPKGSYLAFYQKDETNVTDYPLVDINTTPASVKTIKYPMAGQKSERARVGIFNLKTKSTTYLDIDTSDEHYLTNLSWTPDEKYILIAEVNREQNQYFLNRYDISTGKFVNTILTEKNDKWVEPEKPAFFLPGDNNQFIWMSEKSGFMNLYIYNINGKLKKQLTDFKWVVNDVLGFDKSGDNVFISGTGSDPRQERTFKVNLKSGKHTDLTPIDGSHSVSISFDGLYAIDSYSSITIPNNIDIIDLKRNKRTNIHTASDPLQRYYHGTIEFVKIKADDGKTDLYGKVIKPHDFNPNKKYPVLLYVYGGPHAQLVQNTWLGSSEVWKFFLASNEQYIVYTFDNRGSDNRGFEFESVIHKNTATIPVKDQMTAVEYIKKQPFVDKDRMAVFGWSYGGFMTSSLMLRYPNTFKVAVAGGAVIDWKFYEIMYGERYMDTPQDNPQGYEDTRVANYIKNLNGKLLYLHGYVDDVVVPQHAMEISNAAIKEGKTIDFFFYPTHKHNVSGNDRNHMVKKIVEYIVENNK